MIVRFLASIAAGLLVGNVLSEAGRVGLAQLVPGTIDPSLLLGSNSPDSASLMLLLVLWLLAACSSAAMATAAAGTSAAGWLCALCWASAMLLTGGLAGTDAIILSTGVATTFAGTLLGNRIALAAAQPTSTVPD